MKTDVIIRILLEFVSNLIDIGLEVKFHEDWRSLAKTTNKDGKFYISIVDKNKVLCNYPKDQDWLINKPVILSFFKDLENFGIKRIEDYLIYAGGVNINIVFTVEKSILETKFISLNRNNKLEKLI